MEHYNKNYNFIINYPENWSYNEKFKADTSVSSPVKFFDATGQGCTVLLQVQFINDQNFDGFETGKQAFGFLNSYIKLDCNKYAFGKIEDKKLLTEDEIVLY